MDDIYKEQSELVSRIVGQAERKLLFAKSKLLDETRYCNLDEIAEDCRAYLKAHTDYQFAVQVQAEHHRIQHERNQTTPPQTDRPN